MKSNHNTLKSKERIVSGAFNISKIQDEIKSQLKKHPAFISRGAFNISKIQDEIKSQLVNAPPILKVGCFQYFKDTR